VRIYIVRHTAVKIEPGVCYGQSEVDLDLENYAAALEDIRQKLSSVRFDVCFTSPSIRCSKLAGDLYGADFIKDARLLELNFGQWEL
jgi:alpha-ribazole phosphatase